MKEMKDSGHEWVGEIPEKWEMRKGKYLFVQRSARGNNIELQLLSPTQKFGVVPQSLYEELTGMNAVKLNEETDLSFLKTIHKGDFCISLRSFQGGFEYSAYEGVVSPAYQVFYPIVEIADGYYKYLFKESRFIEKMNSYSMTLRDGKNIAFTDFGNTYIPYPPVEEQIRIAAFLNEKCAEIDALSADIQAQIDTLEEYKRSVITEAVTKGLYPDEKTRYSGIDWLGDIADSWRITKLKYHAEKIGDGIHGTPEYSDDGEYVFINGGNLNGDAIKLNGNEGRVSKQEFVRLYNCALKENSILIALNGTYGTISYYHNEKVLLGKSAGYITLKNTLLPRYVGYYLMSFPAREHMNLSLLSTTVPNLSLGTLKNFPLPFPPLDTQERIIRYLDSKCSKIDELIQDKKESLTCLDSIKKSLIFECVTGKKEVSAS